MHLTQRRRGGWVIGDTENRFATTISLFPWQHVSSRFVLWRVLFATLSFPRLLFFREQSPLPWVCLVWLPSLLLSCCADASIEGLKVDFNCIVSRHFVVSYTVLRIMYNVRKNEDWREILHIYFFDFCLLFKIVVKLIKLRL